jgi:hypothetical protein
MIKKIYCGKIANEEKAARVINKIRQNPFQ